MTCLYIDFCIYNFLHKINQVFKYKLKIYLVSYKNIMFQINKIKNICLGFQLFPCVFQLCFTYHNIP